MFHGQNMHLAVSASRGGPSLGSMSDLGVPPVCCVFCEQFVYFTLERGFTRYARYLWCFLYITCVSCLVNGLCTLHCQED